MGGELNLQVTLPRPVRRVAVIKAGATRVSAGGGRTAARVVSPSQAQAVADAAAQLEQLKAQLQRQAQAEMAQLQSAKEAMLQAAADLSHVQQQVLADAPHQLAQLAVQIARKVLMQEIAAGTYEIDPIVQEAMKSLPPRAQVHARLNPADLAKCSLARDGQQGVTFLADPNVAPACCVLESDQGVVESDVELHLQEIAVALAEGK